MARGGVYRVVRVIIRVDSKTPVTGCYELVGYSLIGWLGCELSGSYWVDLAGGHIRRFQA